MITKPKAGYINNPIFLSYTSLKDFLNCPRSYYLKNIYKDAKTGFRIQIASSYLSLGSTVHDAVKWYLDIEGQTTYPQLEKKFRNFWLKFRGKRGGFVSDDEEATFGKRGLLMLDNFFKNAKVLEKCAPNIVFPKFNLLDNVVLIGNFDFVGERQDGSLSVCDFKTGATDEKDPMQLYIYAILAEANFEKEVTKASFWYLDRDDKPREIVLDPLEPKLEWLKEKAKELKEAIGRGEWVCVKSSVSGGENLCRECKAYQAVLDGKGEFMFSDYKFKKDIYFLDRIS